MNSFSLRRLCWAGPVAAISAALINLVYFLVTKSLGEPYLLPLEGNPASRIAMPAWMPLVLTLMAGFLATILFALLIRFTRSPAVIFLSVSVAALVLSFGAPFNLPIATWQLKFLLGGMNLIAAATLAGGILLLSRRK